MTSKRERVHAFMERFPLALTCGLGLVVWLGLPGSGQAAEEPVRVCSTEPTGDFIEYGDLIDCSINVQGDLDVFRFSGRDKETVAIRVVELAGPGDACISLLDRDGEELDFSCTGITTTLDQDGTYTIRVYEDGNNATVQYRLSVQCIKGSPDGCPVTPIPDVSGCVHFMGAPLVNRSVDLLQTGEPTQRTRTDTRGCYKFNQAVSGKPFRVILRGPAVP